MCVREREAGLVVEETALKISERKRERREEGREGGKEGGRKGEKPGVRGDGARNLAAAAVEREGSDAGPARAVCVRARVTVRACQRSMV